MQADEKTFGSGNGIVFKDVSFIYLVSAEEMLLNSFSLTLKNGTSIGIVGASGSGNSTIAALLRRLYEPAQGRISIGGHPVPEYNLSSLRQRIALVDQDPVLFAGTVYTNIKDGFKGEKLA